MSPSGEHAFDIRAQREQGVYIQVLETDGEQARWFTSEISTSAFFR
jgi:hypothetical protein